MKVIVTGGSGMIGSNFLALFSEKRFTPISVYNSTPTEFEFCKNLKVDIAKNVDVLEKENPDLIIHCAAITNIAECEKNQEKAERVNVEGTKNIVELAKKTGSKLVYLSTDAVFSGEEGNYSEKDSPNPATFYGKTKHEAEKLCEDFLIIRTNVFGFNKLKRKRNFIENILHHLDSGKSFGGFTDAYFSPVSVEFLFETIMKLVEKNAKGIYHVGSDRISKYDFCVLVAREFGKDTSLLKKGSVSSVSSEISYPKDVSLDSSKVKKFLDIPKVSEMMRSFRKDL